MSNETVFVTIADFHDHEGEDTTIVGSPVTRNAEDADWSEFAARKYATLDDSAVACHPDASSRHPKTPVSLTPHVAGAVADQSLSHSILADDELVHFTDYRVYELEHVESVTEDEEYLVLVYDGQDMHMPWSLAGVERATGIDTHSDLALRAGVAEQTLDWYDVRCYEVLNGPVHIEKTQLFDADVLDAATATEAGRDE